MLINIGRLLMLCVWGFLILNLVHPFPRPLNIFVTDQGVNHDNSHCQKDDISPDHIYFITCFTRHSIYLPSSSE